MPANACPRKNPRPPAASLLGSTVLGSRKLDKVKYSDTSNDQLSEAEIRMHAYRTKDPSYSLVTAGQLSSILRTRSVHTPYSYIVVVHHPQTHRDPSDPSALLGRLVMSRRSLFMVDVIGWTLCSVSACENIIQ
jgi:hypothetical protein